MAKQMTPQAQPTSARPQTPASPQPGAKPASSTSPSYKIVPSEEEIRVRAYQKWEAAGKPAGDGMRFWLDAERELKAGK
jgi:hypothetical protein